MSVPSVEGMWAIDVSDSPNNSSPAPLVTANNLATDYHSNGTENHHGLLRYSQNMLDAADRDDNPRGAVVELVADFVNGFVEQVGFEHDLKVFAVFRNENRVTGRVQIALQKDAAHLAVPQIGPTLQERPAFLTHGWLPKRAVSGILKRTHHACDIAQRGAFEFAFAQRPGRFAFKIENDKIFSGIEQLSQMIVAVNPDFSGIGSAIEQPLFARKNFLLRGQHFPRFIAKSSGEVRQFLLQQSKRPPQ